MSTPLFSTLLTQYMDATTDSAVASETRPRSQDLAVDYLQWLTGREEFKLPAAWRPMDWVDQGPAGTISQLAVFHPATPEPDRGRPARHRQPPVPATGDIVVFDTITGGLLGLFLDRGPHEWYVYTQGPGPAHVAAVPTEDYPPLGWWRPRSERLAVEHLRAWQERTTRFVATP